MAERRERTRIKRPGTAPAVEEVRPAIAEQIRAEQGGGAALEPSVQARMEAGFGHNFADVRVHADEKADAISQSVGAKAFTLDRDIFLSQAASSDGAAGGDQLLAHELAHVVQQRGATSGGPLTVAPADDAREQEARDAGDALAGSNGRAGGLTPVPRPSMSTGRAMLQRQPTDPPTADPAATAASYLQYLNPVTSATAAFNVGAALLSDPDKAMQGYHGPVDVDGWHERRIAGQVPASAVRDPAASYIGDQIVVSAKIVGPAAASIDTLRTTEFVLARPGYGASKLQIEKTVKAPDTIVWTITPLTPGHQDVQLKIGDALGLNGDDLTIEIAAGADPTWFKGRCATAESHLNMLYARGQTWFYDCYLNYINAYRTFDAAVRAQSAADRLVGELLLGVLFAGAGGFVGGAVGGKIGSMMQDVEKGGKVIFQGLSAATKGGITDTAKDISKWITRLPDGPLREKVLGSAGGAGKVATDAAQASTDPSRAGVAQGEGAVAAIDPENWFALIQRAINNERAEVGKILTDLHNVMDEFVLTDPSSIWDWDPVQTVTENAMLDGKPLDNLGNIPESAAYERSMWEVWLANYSWKVLETYGVMGNTAQVYRNVGGKLEDAIDKVAKKFGESGEDWIERYGAGSKFAAEAKARKINQNNPLGRAANVLDDMLRRQ